MSTGSAWRHLLWLLGRPGLGITAVLLEGRCHRVRAGAAGLLRAVLPGGAQLP